jgi:hypothetical protein
MTTIDWVIVSILVLPGWVALATFVLIGKTFYKVKRESDGERHNAALTGERREEL